MNIEKICYEWIPDAFAVSMGLGKGINDAMNQGAFSGTSPISAPVGVKMAAKLIYARNVLEEYNEKPFLNDAEIDVTKLSFQTIVEGSKGFLEENLGYLVGYGIGMLINNF